MSRRVDRETLAVQNKLAPSDVEEITKSLDALDAESAPLARRALQLVSEQPGVVSVVLSRQIGIDRYACRTLLHGLRDLGLVYGLDVGFSISPRGRAYMRLVEGTPS